MEDKKESPETVWKRLTRLFRSGPVVRHKIAAGEKIPQPAGTARAYKKELSALYVRSLASYANYERLSRYSDYQEMEYCLHGDTLIAVPDGFKKISDLADEYGLEKEFIVYSYDHSIGKIVPAIAKQARKTRTADAWTVTFDNGKQITGTADHRLMLRDGSYREICDLQIGDSMMPFKRCSILNNDKHNTDDYQFIYNGINHGKNGWVSEHRMIASWVAGRKLNDGEEVHHINFKKSDNRPENLKIMNEHDHRSLHSKIINGKKWSIENSQWIEEFKAKHSAFMKLNNPAERKDITFEKILYLCDQVGFNCKKICEILNTDPATIKRKLKKKSFSSWTNFAKAYDSNWKNSGQNNSDSNNPKFDKFFTFQMICDAFQEGMDSTQLIEKLGESKFKINKRIQMNGFSDINDFCSNYQNCKVKSVEYYGTIDLYDLTVDKYKNFATDSVISHNTPELHGAIDIYADEATVKNDDGDVINITSKNAEIKEVLESLFFEVLDINFNSWMWMRHLCKFGDLCLFVDAKDDGGILNLVPIPINEIEREEGFDEKDPLAVRFRWLTRGNSILENWQIIHFRLLGNDSYLPYGTSVLEPARRIWRQLILIEDAMLVYRIVRSPERRVFHIEIANTPPDQVDTFMEQVKTQLQRNTIVDPTTGRVDLRYNPLSVEEDYFLPKRGEQKTQIDTLSGGQFTGDIEDVQYIQSKMFAALKIPRAYLGYEDQIGSKATLAQEDVRFSKTIERIQSLFVAELNKIAIIHLFLLGYSNDDLVNFNISMANPSTVREQQLLELWRMKLEVAGMAQEGVFDRGFVYRKIFGLNDRQIAAIKDGKRIDKLEDALLQSIEAPPMPSTDQGPQAPSPEPAPPEPGAEQLPTTLGGPEPASAEPTPVQVASFKLPGNMISEVRNRGSQGNDASISVVKGKNLFSTGENQFRLSFGTEKQTASDPNDRRYAHRMITRPFSEDEENVSMLGQDQIDEIDEMLENIDIFLQQSNRVKA